jgi:FtsZ-binding cell division protein ZapB
MWIRVPTLVSELSPEIKSLLDENGIHATAMSVCFDVPSHRDIYAIMQKGFKVRSDVHTVECDQLVIDSLRFDNQQLMQHCQRCEAMVRKLQMEISQLSYRLDTYEHILT